MKITRGAIRASIILLVFFAGCSSLQNTNNPQRPAASLKDVRIENASASSLNLLFDVEIQNPNRFALPMTGIDYSVTSKASCLFSGKEQINETIPAMSTKTVTLPVTTDNLDFEVAFEETSPGSKVPYKANAELSMITPAGSMINLQLNKTGELDVPYIPKADTIEQSIYTYSIDGLPVKTGDLICTTVGGKEFFTGQLWDIIGMIIPGEVDHIVIYIGPGGRCVEEGGKLCVNKFEVMNKTWNAAIMADQRGLIIDKLYGVVYPLAGMHISEEEEMKIRLDVARFCLQQAKLRTPYNFNYFDSQTDKALYCSQLAYKAYLRSGINLNTGKGIKEIPGTEIAIYPQEIWGSWEHKRAGQKGIE